MKKIKLISLVTVLAVPLSLCSCSLENFGYDYDSEYSEAVSGEQAESYDYENIDLDDFNEDVKQLLDDIKKSDNEKAVQNGIDNLLRQADIASDAMSYSCIESYLEWDNSDLEYDYDSLSETFYVICDALGYAFAKGSKSNEYSELFKELTDDESVEYFTQKGMNLSRVEGYASVDYSVSDDFLDDYYETAYDDSLSDDEKNLRCAEVYLEILSNINPEYYYENYNRDYTPDDILKLSKTVREKLQPVANELYDKFEDNKQSDNIFEKPVIFDNPFETIREYSARLSPDIENTANKIINDKLYTIVGGQLLQRLFYCRSADK